MLKNRKGNVMAETMDLVMENPAERRAYHWLGAIESLKEMLDADALCPDPKGWDNVFVLLRRIAKDRKQAVVEAELWQEAAAQRRASEQQLIADQWTSHADEDDRLKDELAMDPRD